MINNKSLLYTILYFTAAAAAIAIAHGMKPKQQKIQQLTNQRIYWIGRVPPDQDRELGIMVGKDQGKQHSFHFPAATTEPKPSYENCISKGWKFATQIPMLGNNFKKKRQWNVSIKKYEAETMVNHPAGTAN